MHYVYVLQSQKDHSLYVGMTSDLKKRMEEHLKADKGFTKGHALYKLMFYAAMTSKSKAHDFEVYLKSGSGRAFLSRHIVNDV